MNKLSISILRFFMLFLPLLPAYSQTPQPEKVAYNIPVICYHHITDDDMKGFNVKVKEFENQMEYLHNNGFQPVTLDQFYDAMKGRPVAGLTGKPVLLTFDDGSKSVYQHAYPVLKKYKFKSTLFLYPSVIENKKFKKYMNWTEIKVLLQSGLFDVGSHSYYHPKLVDMSEKEIREQLVKSRNVLNEKLGVQVKDIAFPFGLYDERVLKLMTETGYRSGFTINPGNNLTGDNLFTLQRVLMTESDSVKRFSSYLSKSTIMNFKIVPADSSIVRVGEKFRINFLKNTPEKMAIKINGKIIKLTRNQNGYTGYFPDFKKRKILTMNLSGKLNGTSQSRQLMFILDKNRQQNNEMTEYAE